MAKKGPTSSSVLPIIPTDAFTVLEDGKKGPCGITFDSVPCRTRRDSLATGNGMSPQQIEECSACRLNPQPVVSTRATPESVLDIIVGIAENRPDELDSLLECLEPKLARVIRLWNDTQRDRFRRALRLHRPDKETRVPSKAKNLKRLLSS